MDRNPLYRPPTSLLDGEDDEIAPWEAERLAREAIHRDPDPIGPDRLVSARNPEVQRVSSLGLVLQPGSFDQSQYFPMKSEG